MSLKDKINYSNVRIVAVFEWLTLIIIELMSRSCDVSGRGTFREAIGDDHRIFPFGLVIFPLLSDLRAVIDELKLDLIGVSTDILFFRSNLPLVFVLNDDMDDDEVVLVRSE